jgi:hypothetical protein
MKRLRVSRHRQPLLLRGFRANVQDRTFPVTPFTGRCPALSAKLSKNRAVRGMMALVFSIGALLTAGGVFSLRSGF